jgi:hypothetical protein
MLRNTLLGEVLLPIPILQLSDPSPKEVEKLAETHSARKQ